MQLDRKDSLRLLKFVCTFAWTDLQVQPQERDLVMRIAGRLGVTGKDLAQVQQWLAMPPKADEVDPASVPKQHRELFVHAAEWAIKADGKVVPAERDAMQLFRALLR